MRKDLAGYVLTGLTVGVICFYSIGSAYAEMTDKSEAPASKTEMRELKGGRRSPGMSGTDTDSLVADGVISQDTADKIAAYMETKNAERQAEMEKVKAMTDEEKQAYFESGKNKDDVKKDMFAEMVEAGVITQAEADAIKAAMPEKQEPVEDGGMRSRGMSFDSLVTDGVISQDTADKIAAYMESKSAERKAEMEKVKAMTDEEKQAYLESGKNKDDLKKDMFAGMVEAGVITQAEADAIKAAMPERPEPAGDEQNDERKAEMDKVKAMTDEEKQAYFESKMPSRDEANQDEAGTAKSAKRQPPAGNGQVPGLGGEKSAKPASESL